MNAEQIVPQEWIIPALISHIQWQKDESLGTLKLNTLDQQLECHTFLDPWLYSRLESETIGFARVIPSLNTANEPIYLMVDFKQDDTMKTLYYVNADCCPHVGIVDQVRALVQCIHHDDLRELVEDALSLPEVNRYFWTCPASIKDHHCYAGGLAQHTTEVATMIVCSNLDTQDKDMGLAFALLHDIGKVQSYEQGQLTDEAQTIGHEGIGYNILKPLLDQLKLRDDSCGNTMTELLNSTWRQSTYKRRPLAIGRVVNAFDQFSCERNLQKQIKKHSAESFHREDVVFFES